MATIRVATEADLPAILAIYNDAVMKTTAIWNEAPSTLESRLAWFAERRKAGFPVLVAEDEGVVGYGSFGEFRPFEGYRYTVEHSVYVREGARGQGVGKALLAQALLCKLQRAKQATQQVVEVVGDAAGQLADRLHFLRLAQGLFGLAQAFLLGHALGDVIGEQVSALDLLLRIEQWVIADFVMAGGIGGAE